MNLTEPLTQIGKYKILAVLGRGGMGVVYRAEDKFIGREVAIKTLVDATPEMRQRFAIEARSGVLNHPNVVTVYDFGEHEDNPYIVMEFLHGQSLDLLVKEKQPLTLVEKLDIVRQVCEGLGYAHSRGVIHRDIKPANIVVLGNGCVKLVDFGIAQLETLSGHTVAGSVIGTYQYLSPERLKGEPSDSRADIWSAGVVLYLLLTGTLPFPGEDISALHRVITDAYPPLGTLLSTAYPTSLDNIIARALAKDPAQRYPTALEMAGDLEATRDAIRLSRMEDLLGQVRSLIDKDELQRARPLLLDLQRLAPQNTAVRNLLRELGERLTHQPERLAEARGPETEATGRINTQGMAAGAASPETAAASPDHATPPEAAQSMAEQEERRRRIIAQIVIEIRGQAERGNQARALELVQRSLERAPGNEALMALQEQIEAMIAAVSAPPSPAVPPQEIIETKAVETGATEAEPIEAALKAKPVEAEVVQALAPPPGLQSSLPPDPPSPPEWAREPHSLHTESPTSPLITAPEAGIPPVSVTETGHTVPPELPPQSPQVDVLGEPIPGRPAPATVREFPSLEALVSTPEAPAPEISTPAALKPEAPTPAAPEVAAAKPAIPNVRAQDLRVPEFPLPDLAVSELQTQPATPEPTLTTGSLPDSPLSKPVHSAKPELPSLAPLPSPASTVRQSESGSLPAPASDTARPPILEGPRPPAANGSRTSVPEASRPLAGAPAKTPVLTPSATARRSGQFGLIALGVVVLGLLAAVLFAVLHHRPKPVPLPATYAQIIASPYARVVQVTADGGASVSLPPGDHLTPLRLSDLRPGSYTLDLQAEGGQVTQAHCRFDAQQHVCFAGSATLSDAEVQAILDGGPRQ